ncbi:MAG: TrkA family potassium uptake protein [Clostridia bacterium]|nr:TrkA family potassium uptake protein [Clostridia bacterium]
MKSILVIGMGRFGVNLATQMQKLGNQVMIVDEDEQIIELLASTFHDCHVGNCTNEFILKSLDVKSFDICFVAIGSNFESSLVITILLKKLGAKKIVAKAAQEIQANVLNMVGADEVIFPERDMAESLAVKYSATNVFDYLELSDEYGIFEIPILSYWVGQTIIKIDVRKKYKLNIIAVKNGDNMSISPAADYAFRENDHVIVVGKQENVLRLTEKM